MIEPIGFSLENFDAIGRWRTPGGTTIRHEFPVDGGYDIDLVTANYTFVDERLAQPYGTTAVERCAN